MGRATQLSRWHGILEKGRKSHRSADLVPATALAGHGRTIRIEIIGFYISFDRELFL